ncbi:type IV pilus biogenesis protein PilM [Cronobacter sakazakii]|uniref:type IV pilus biogenesis protein PilM n=1 Tax=Cronobacter sakazakii TaxID=28141 RepID=UPI00293805BB|nr:type IV pilus biogenesis protein PilM [Cronobacter sakazakii]EKS1073441.1 type IV pilus biogenesis protein PilM [Cronobacter sakazakii]EKS1087119.1 type IV pilus biogenesis protein PilM [Cronobacter sakazakii]ELQ5973795.1 type IV pilus biogenesis protein PilM [Cronobacter sakazakii]ELQ6034815.1 type IV pilus biogenesis protein PilM [Cronobacter sakazakii]ELQ6043530.1 type IV pilus biogenesis protein PilM [Cronobacter sakazakii]
MKSYFLAAALVVAVSILLSCVSDANRNAVETVSQQQAAGQFLHYVAALNALYGSGTPPDGDAVDRISLPQWLPHNTTIQARISGGIGYVFMPASPGVFTQVLYDTENSSHFGFSDAVGINTNSGRLVRPGFIPPGYVVYMR